jgi:hypothetical protein
MVQKCNECGADLPDQAKFCLNCRSQIGMKKEVHQVAAEGLVGKVKELVKDANVKRIVIKDDKGKVLLSIQSPGERLEL